MRVTHVEDHITHAVIGGGDAIDFSVDDSPEFMHMLSVVMYKDQPLAAVRETLCNAWDAHIEAGITDRAVEVSVFNNEMVIKDYGLGIPHNIIGSVYGTYGRSTKKNDGRATGGFGLGCKSPFAYTDNFEVESANQGLSTIYRLSKSNAEVGGKPSIIPIVSYNTEDTGLKVTVPLKSIYDADTFIKLVEKIARQGDMKVVLKTSEHSPFKPIATIPFSTMTQGFLITNKKDLHDHTTIMVRYGNVLYPIGPHAEYIDAYKHVKDFLDKLGGTNTWNKITWKIVFQAEPNSISITPSREELSMQAHTITTVKKLLTDFSQKIEAELSLKYDTLLDTYLDENMRNWHFHKVSTHARSIGLVSGQSSGISLEYHTNLDTAMAQYVVSNYPTGVEFLYNDILKRVTALNNYGVGNKRYMPELLSMVQRMANGERKLDRAKSWFHKMFVGPLINRLIRNGLDPKQLLSLYKSGRNQRNHQYGYGVEFAPAYEMPKQDIEKAILYTKNVVILTHNRMQINTLTYDEDRIFDRAFNKFDGCFAYVVPRNQEIKDKAAKLFSDMGYAVFDSTIRQEDMRLADAAQRKAERARKAKEPKAIVEKKVAKPKGVYAISNYKSNRFDWRRERTIQDIYLEKPAFVYRAPGERTPPGGDPVAKYFDKATIRLIDSCWPNQGAVVHSNPEFHDWIGKGSLNTLQFVAKMLVHEFKTNDELKALIEMDWKRLPVATVCDQQIIQHIYRDPYLADAFHVQYEATDRAKAIYRLFRYMNDTYYLRKEIPDELLLIKTKIDREIPVKKTVRAMVQLVNSSTLTKLIDINEFRNPTHNPFDYDLGIMRKILLLILKG